MQSGSTPNEDLDPGSLDEIGVEECWQLLSSRPIGRVAVIVGHYPLVFPVNYTVDARAIVYRTNAGTKLWAIHRSNVTFQVDEIDQIHRSGRAPSAGPRTIHSFADWCQADGMETPARPSDPRRTHHWRTYDPRSLPGRPARPMSRIRADPLRVGAAGR